MTHPFVFKTIFHPHHKRSYHHHHVFYISLSVFPSSHFISLPSFISSTRSITGIHHNLLSFCLFSFCLSLFLSFNIPTSQCFRNSRVILPKQPIQPRAWICSYETLHSFLKCYSVHIFDGLELIILCFK